jgi:hypothetical protein
VLQASGSFEMQEIARISQFSKFTICEKHNIFKILSKFEFLF